MSNARLGISLYIRRRHNAFSKHIHDKMIKDPIWMIDNMKQGDETMYSLKGKVAIVTGSARGIGFVSAEKLAEMGASVILSDINEAVLNQSVQTLKDKGYAVASVVTDVTSVESLQKAMAAAAEIFGGLDIIVNNAGILGTSSIEDMDKEKEWNKVLDVNLSGTFFATQAALPYLKKSKSGRIINMSSVTGRNGGFEGSMSYAASKGGIVAITRGMARRLAPLNITVNAVCPGATETEILKGYSQEQIENQLKNILLHRLGKPEEIAAAVCYLASDEAGFVTGLMLDINGGGYFG